MRKMLFALAFLLPVLPLFAQEKAARPSEGQKTIQTNFQEELRQTPAQNLQIAIEAMVVEVNEDRTRELGVDYTLDVNDLGNANLDQIDMAKLAGISANITDIVIDDFASIAANIRALVEKGEAKIRTRPVAVALNNTMVEIVTANEIPYQDIRADNRGRSQLQVSFEQVGVILKVTPRIQNPQKKEFIELTIHDLVVSGVSQYVTVREVNRPIFVTSRARTAVVLRDSETLVIGGLKTEREVVQETAIPFLGRIPWIGWLFKYKNIDMQRSNIFFFITPRLLTPGVNPILPFDFQNYQTILDSKQPKKPKDLFGPSLFEEE